MGVDLNVLDKGLKIFQDHVFAGNKAQAELQYMTLHNKDYLQIDDKNKLLLEKVQLLIQKRTDLTIALKNQKDLESLNPTDTLNLGLYHDLGLKISELQQEITEVYESISKECESISGESAKVFIEQSRKQSQELIEQSKRRSQELKEEHEELAKLHRSINEFESKELESMESSGSISTKDKSRQKNVFREARQALFNQLSEQYSKSKNDSLAKRFAEKAKRTAHKIAAVTLRLESEKRQKNEARKKEELETYQKYSSDRAIDNSVNELSRSFRFWFGPVRFLNALYNLHVRCNIITPENEKENINYEAIYKSIFSKYSTYKLVQLYNCLNSEPVFRLKKAFTTNESDSSEVKEYKLVVGSVFDVFLSCLHGELSHRNMLKRDCGYDAWEKNSTSVRISSENNVIRKLANEKARIARQQRPAFSP